MVDGSNESEETLYDTIASSGVQVRKEMRLFVSNFYLVSGSKQIYTEM